MEPTARSVIFEEPHSFQFFATDSGEHYLEVLCGSSAMFTVCIRLTEEELSYYREFGPYYIDKLVRDINYSPKSFIVRNVTGV